MAGTDIDLVVRSTIQGMLLSALSNIIAQLLSAYQSNSSYTIDPLPVARFTAFSLISTPPNIAWQSLLESYFPARPAGKLSWRNTAAKFALDQTFGALFNTLLFIVGMDLLRGETEWSVMSAHVQDQARPLYKAGQRIWPLASLVGFTLIPLQWRTVFGGSVGVGWGVYLSLLEGQHKA